jgi:predicted ribosome quality control (RQC) complex YloA/Tae2 family protein
MEMMIWNIILSGIVAVLGFLVKGKFDELDRITILLNRTREEVARDHVTRAEVNQTMDRLADKIEASIQRLEAKIDQIHQKA